MRPDWDTYFMEITNIVASRSTCVKRHVGAVIVKNNNILSIGYNGAPSGIQHCTNKTCLRQNAEHGYDYMSCRSSHAEQNAIVQAAKLGVSINGSKLYCTTQPCIICARMIINAGIKEVIYTEEFDDDMTLEMLKEAGVKIKVFKSIN